MCFSEGILFICFMTMARNGENKNEKIFSEAPENWQSKSKLIVYV